MLTHANPLLVCHGWGSYADIVSQLSLVAFNPNSYGRGPIGPPILQREKTLKLLKGAQA